MPAPYLALQDGNGHSTAVEFDLETSGMEDHSSLDTSERFVLLCDEFMEI